MISHIASSIVWVVLIKPLVLPLTHFVAAALLASWENVDKLG
jgi:hypothetical protein